jgi:hypothetical protein
VKKLTFSIVFLAVFGRFFAQTSGQTTTDFAVDPLVQFSGVVVTNIDGQIVPVPYATIYIVDKNRGTFSDRRGFFNLVVERKDIVRFSCVGFENAETLVPDTLQSDHYSVIQILSQDSIMLPQIVIYPWPSKEHFKAEFLAMDVTEEMQELAAQNLANESLNQLRKSPDAVAFSGKEGANFYLRQQAKSYYYFGQTPPMNIFSPLAWGKFIQAWKNGEYKRKKGG